MGAPVVGGVPVSAVESAVTVELSLREAVERARDQMRGHDAAIARMCTGKRVSFQVEGEVGKRGDIVADAFYRGGEVLLWMTHWSDRIGSRAVPLSQVEFI